MRAPGEILLVSCYELGHQPLSLAAPLGALERAGFAPRAIDLAVERLDPALVAAARLVAISVPMHTALRVGTRAAARVRERNPGCTIAFYGLYASLNAAHLLDVHADAVIGGESEEALVALARALEFRGHNTKPGVVPEVSGVRTREHPARPPLRKPPPPGLPSRGALPVLDRYARLRREESLGLVGYTEASRGCLHLCTHCPITPEYQGRFFVVPREIVLADVEQLVAAGATHITFGDPDFLNGPRHSLEIVRELHRRWPEVTFDATIKVEHIVQRPEVFPELAAHGCAFVVSAVESLSERVLHELRKGHTRDDVHQALRITRSAGIPLRPTFVAFTPWTTPEDYLDLFDLVEREELWDRVDPVQFAIRLLIPPGAALLATPGEKPWLGPLAPDRLAFTWTHPDPRMDPLADDARELVAAAADESPLATIRRLRALADAALGRVPRALAADRPLRMRESPRLTEPWFC